MLAYNTPSPMPVEAELEAMAADVRRPVARQGARQHLEGAERQRRAARGGRRVRRHLRRRPPPDAGRLRPRVALDRRRRRRRPGPLRDPQRRRLLADQAGRRRVRADLRRLAPGPRGPARVRCLRRVQRLLARLRAGADPAAGVVPHRGHRGVDARARGRRPAGQRPGPDQPRAGARHGLRAVEPADALGPGLVPGVLPAPVADPALAPAEPAAEARRELPARLARGLPVDRDDRVAAARLPGLA